MSAELIKKLSLPLARPRLGEDEVFAAVEVIQSGQLCQSEVTQQFEAEFAQAIGARHAIAVSSGSAALLVAMQAMGVRAGDEVMVPDVTFVTTATAAMYLGARPVFCDISWEDYCIDVEKVGALITPRTKLIIPVHFGGRVADVARLREVAADRGTLILEDAAGAHLARTASGFAGTLGHAGIFSFTPSKVMTTGEGGMITTNDDGLAESCRKIRNFGDHGKFQWETLGFNFRMTALSAALGLEQLKYLEEAIDHRRRVADRYTAAFDDHPWITPPPSGPVTANSFQLYPLLLDVDALGVTCDEIIAALAEFGVAARLYYPALHRMGVFAELSPPPDADFPVALEFERRSVCVPIYSDMTPLEQNHVISSVLEVMSSRHR